MADFEYGWNFGDRLDKIVVIGDVLTRDILFGNLNGMKTVWITKYKDTCRALNAKNKDWFNLE